MKCVKVDISNYVSIFRKKPHGVGHWAFRIAGELNVYEFAEYGAAKRKAAKQAESRQIGVIYLMA